MKKLLSMLLVISMVLSSMMLAVGCSDDDTTGGTPACEHSYTDGVCDKCGDKDITKIEANLNGAALGSYSIVYSEDTDYAERAAKYIQTQIKARAGKELSLRKASEDSGEGRAILVGDTARELSAELSADCADLQFAICSDGEDIALEGELFVIAAAAYYFISEYIENGVDFDSVVPSEVQILEPIKEEADNFFLMIGDGMGEVHTRLFDYLEVSAEGAAISDGESEFYGYMLPYFGYSMTDSLSGTTDSAAAATAMATGYKTYNRYLGLDGDKVARKSLTELAVELSMGAAIFTTDTLTGATPGGFTVHVEDRGNSDEIRRQQSALMADFGVVIDGTYQQYTKNIMKLIEREFSEALDKIADEDGIFVMYEEAHIDKACSSLNIDNAFLSLIRFNQIIGRVMEYAFYHPNTMVIITADHETGDLIIDEEGRPIIQTEEHTSKNVPLFAYGVGAEVFDGKTIENTQIPKIIASLWGFSDFAK